MALSEDVWSELPGYLRTLWELPDQSKRGPKPSVSLREIGAAGVEVADRDGLPAVSMARVAKELGFTTMALYRYVDSKDELLAVMLDEAYGPPPAVSTSRSWRHRLEAWARAIKGQLYVHPWILQLPISSPPLTPVVLMWTEHGLRSLAGTKLSAQEKLSSMLVVDGYVRNQTQLTMQLFGTGSGNAADQSRIDAGRRYDQGLQLLVDAERYPALYEATASGALGDARDFGTEEFDFGLERVLDGIAVLADRRAKEARGGKAHGGSLGG